MKRPHLSLLGSVRLAPAWHQTSHVEWNISRPFLFDRRLQSSFFADLLVGQRFHEAFFTAEQRECGYIHALQNFQNFFSFRPGENVLYQLISPIAVSEDKRLFVAFIEVSFVSEVRANCIFALLGVMPLVADYIRTQALNTGNAICATFPFPCIFYICIDSYLPFIWHHILSESKICSNVM